MPPTTASTKASTTAKRISVAAEIEDDAFARALNVEPALAKKRKIFLHLFSFIFHFFFHLISFFLWFILK